MKDKHSGRTRGTPGRVKGRPAGQIRWSGMVCRTSVEKMVPGGLGLCRYEGQVVFVPGVLPGEQIEIELSEAKGGYRSGRLRKLEAASPDRVEAICPVYGQCGGCNLQHASYPAQLLYKQSMLEDCLRRQGGYGIEGILPVIRTVSGEAWGYRNRQQYHILAHGQGLGFRQRESSAIVPIRDCPVASPEIRHWLATDPRPTISKGGREGPPVEESPSLQDELDGGGRYPVFGSDGNMVAGSGEFRLELAGRAVFFAIEGFFQSNLVMLEKLIPILQGWIATMGPVQLAADLYCGCGVFSAFLPENCLKIEAVDNNPDNCRYARLNVDSPRTLVLEESVDTWLLGESAERVELYVLDPPRTGLSRQLLGHLVAKKPRHLVFVSCDPVTFCRDLKELRSGGYRVKELILLDFYPQTAHIETACWLELSNP